jgi:DNA repair protein RadC
MMLIIQKQASKHFALALIDIRVLDHFIIGDGMPYSFAENGLL